MKTRINRIVWIAAALLAVVMMLPLSAAADEEITVNGQKVSKGDTVTFEYYMSGINDAVEAVGSYIDYDEKALEYVEGSIGFDVLNNAMYNIDEGIIYFSAINVMDGYNIKDERLIVSASFKVIDGAKGNIKITNTIDEMFTLENEDVDLTPKDYKARDVLTVNTYEKNTAPYLGVDANDITQYLETVSGDETASDIEGYFEGNPNENAVTSNATASSSEEEAQAEQSDSSNSADTPESISEPQTASEEGEMLSQESVEEKDSSKTVVAIIVIVFVILAVGAAFFLIQGRKNGKS